MEPTETQAAARIDSATEPKAGRIKAVAWLAGVTAVFAIIGMSDSANHVSVGMGIGVIGVSAMVAYVSYLILKVA